MMDGECFFQTSRVEGGAFREPSPPVIVGGCDAEPDGVPAMWCIDLIYGAHQPARAFELRIAVEPHRELIRRNEVVEQHASLLIPVSGTEYFLHSFERPLQQLFGRVSGLGQFMGHGVAILRILTESAGADENRHDARGKMKAPESLGRKRRVATDGLAYLFERFDHHAKRARAGDGFPGLRALFQWQTPYAAQLFHDVCADHGHPLADPPAVRVAESASRRDARGLESFGISGADAPDVLYRTLFEHLRLV